MDQVQISVEANEATSWRQRCHHRMETLKSRQFPSTSGEDPASQPRLLQEEPFGEKNSVILELQKAIIQNENVHGFVDVLERLSSERKLVLSAIFDQVTRAGDSLLHKAAYFRRPEIAELIGHHFPQLLTGTKNKGDTPLHVAARTINSAVIKAILSQYDAHVHTHKSTSSSGSKDENLTRLTNEQWNTALHEAVRSKHVEGITLVFEADQCVAHYLNKSGQSPLFRAIFTGDKSIVDILLEVPFPDDKPLPKCRGNSPLHAAIGMHNAALIKEIVAKKPDLMYLRDEDGGTPLHYAAATGYVEGVRILSNKSALSALEWNAKGHLPIHLACKRGHAKVVEEFLQQEWAYDSGVLANKKGQNILHVAAKNGQHNVVKCILKNTKLDQLEFIINERDKNGNTPLHLAAENFFPKTLFLLTRDTKILLNIINNKGLTAYDTRFLQSEIPAPSRRALSGKVLFTAGGRMTDEGRSMFRERQIESSRNLDGIKNKVNILMLVATLIVTVTFAAGFTVPGSVYGSDDPNPHKRGMVVLGKKSMFQMFVVSNTLAMYSSTFGSYLLLWAHVDDYHLALKSLRFAIFMVGIALVSMTLAFMAAVRLVVSNVPWLANLVTIIGIIFLSLILSTNITDILALFLCGPLLRQVRNFLIWFSILLYGKPPKVKAKKH